MSHRFEWALVAALCAICAGCSNDFDETKMRGTTEGAPVELDSEQVTLTPAQVDCGVDKELWDTPVQVSGDNTFGAQNGRSVAHLRQAARDLGFSDDVSINEPGYSQPYSQMRGKMMLRVENLIDTKDGPGQGIKTVVAQVRVKVPNECFTGDLPIMGIRKGQFNQALPVTMIFALEDKGWRVDHFVH